MADVTMEYKEAVVRQMSAFLESVNLLEHMGTENMSDIFKKLSMIAEAHGVDLKDMDKAERKDGMRLCALEVFRTAGVIKERDGHYEITDRTRYQDMVYTAKYKIQSLEQTRQMLELLKKVPLKKALEQVDGATKVADFLQGMVKTAGSSDVREFADKVAEDLGLDGVTGEDIMEGVKSTVEKQADYLVSGMEVDQEDDRYMKFDLKDPAYIRSLQDAKYLVTGETMEMLQGFLDADRMLRPGEPEITEEIISAPLRYEIRRHKRENPVFWAQSLVGFGKALSGQFAVSGRQGIQKRLAALVGRKKDPEDGKVTARMKFLLAGDRALGSVYTRLFRDADRMNDVVMKAMDTQVDGILGKGDKDAKARGRDFAMLLSERNLFRCGISENIPGWMGCLRAGEEDKAWALAYLKAGMGYGSGGVSWEIEQAERNVQAVYDRYMKMSRGGKHPDKDFKSGVEKLKRDFVAEHKENVARMQEQRKKQGLPPLDYRSHFNHAYDNEKAEKRYRYEVHGISDLENGSLSVRDTLREKGLDGVVVCKNNKLTLMEADEERSVSAILNDKGFIQHMDRNISNTYHKGKDAAERTLFSIKEMWEALEVRLHIHHFREEDWGTVDGMVRWAFKRGYEIRDDGNLITLTDPDGKHEFQVDTWSGSGRSMEDNPNAISYAGRLRDEFLGHILKDTEAGTCYAEILEDLNKRYKDPMYGFVKDPFYEKAGVLEDLMQNLVTLNTSVILDPAKRKECFAGAEQQLGRIDAAEIRKLQTDFHERMAQAKELHRTDPMLAWCRLAVPECEREGDKIVAYSNGVKIGLDRDLRGGAERNTQEARNILNILSDAVSAWKQEFYDPYPEYTPEFNPMPEQQGHGQFHENVEEEPER